MTRAGIPSGENGLAAPSPTTMPNDREHPMINVTILSFSDGRKRVHDTLEPYIAEQAERLRASLESTGEIKVRVAGNIVWNNALAKSEAIACLAGYPDAVILNIPVFAFPNFAMIAASLLTSPCLAIAPVNGKLPGLGGLQAATNAIRQVGLKCDKVWGNIEEDATLQRVISFLRAAHAVTRLKGQVYGLIGGRSIGMASGAVNADAWMRIFGVDADHVDQSEILRRAALVEEARVDAALAWLSQKTGAIRYDGDKLTPDSLKMQIRCHMATRELIDERHFDFVGVKCHYDLSEYYVTQCLSAALFNDPYDWDGARQPTVYSCEADSDGALTMQIMKLISRQPALFFDFRHYDKAAGVFVFCNCGAMSTWYAARSDDPGTNLKKVTLHPIINKYGGKGCHVQYVAAAGEMTLGRLSRVGERYKMTLFRGRLQSFPEEKLQESCPVWPHGFLVPDADPRRVIDSYDSNHVHGIYGDHLDALAKFCELKQIQCEILE